MLHIRPLTDKTQWENFVRQFSPNNFLQSWNFGQFNQADGDPPYYLGAFEGEQLAGVGLFVLTHAKRGDYFACAAGPLVKGTKNVLGSRLEGGEGEARYRMVMEGFLDYLKQQNQAVFVRVRPALLNLPEQAHFFRSMGFRSAAMHLHAERSWLLDLSKSEEELLASMRKNTRYYVKRAAKDGVTVRLSHDQTDVETLYNLQAETVAKHHFVPFSRDYFQQLFAAFDPDDQVVLFTAYFENEPIAAAMINYYGDQAVYHYAAAALKHAKLPAAYAILWEAIREAKRRGCQWFNFWGVVGDDEEQHPWFGLSRFKKGFGGEEVWYLHAQDYPLTWRYWLTYALERYRKWRRGL